MSEPTRKPTLVMGAGGSVGAHVLDGLIAAGLPVRASARRPSAGRFPSGVEVATADLTDPSSLAAAFDGMGQVFLYANVHGVHGVIDAARAAGVERIVLLSSGSVIHPSSAGNTITEEHRLVEDALAAAADLTVVPIRPLVLAANALGWARPITAGAVLPLYRPDAVTAPIHEKDIAAVAVAAVIGPHRDAFSGLLTGPARISQRDQVAAISAVIGRDVAVQGLARRQALAHFARFMPPEEAEAVVRFLDDAAAGSSPATTTVEEVLGRPAIGFDTWAADHAGDFA